MAVSTFRTNHGAIIARLTTDSALWPKARVSVIQMASPRMERVWLIATTTSPRARATDVNTTRLPKRSRRCPIPIAPSEPTSVAQRFTSA